MQLAALAVLLGQTGPECEAAPMPLTDSLIAEWASEAVRHQPALQASKAGLEAAAAAEAGVRVWEDPSFSVGTIAGPGMMRREEGNLIYGLEQKLPLWGKPAAERNIARAETERAAALHDYALQSVRFTIARQALVIASADDIATIRQEDLLWVRGMARVAEERYRNGSGRQSEILRTQNEASLRLLQVETDERNRRQQRIELNRLLGRSLTNDVHHLKLPGIAPALHWSPALEELALRGDGRLGVLDHELHHATARSRLAEKQRLPDVQLVAEARHYTGDAGFREGLLGIKMNLPFFNRQNYRHDRDAAQHRVTGVQAEIEDYRLSLRTEIHRIIAECDTARREALTLRDEVIPRGELAVESARIGWTEGRELFLDVLEARRALLEGKLALIQATARQHSLLAELALRCGTRGAGELVQLVTPSEAIPEIGSATP